MRACGEEFGDAGCFETAFCEADCCSKACAAGSYDYGIVVVVDERVFVRIEV